MALEVEQHRGLGVRAVLLRVELQHGRGHHDEVRVVKDLKLLLRRAHEHLPHEERLARELAQAQYLAGVAAVGARKRVDHEDPALREVADDLSPDLLVSLDRERHVHAAPRDLVVDVGRVDDEAVVRGAARVRAGYDAQAASLGEGSLSALERLLDERRRGAVYDRPVIGVVDAVLCKFLNYHWTSKRRTWTLHI